LAASGFVYDVRAGRLREVEVSSDLGTRVTT